MHCASGGGKRPSNGTALRSVVSSTATLTPAPDRVSAASRSRLRAFFHGRRTASRQKACRERRSRARAAFSTPPPVAEIRRPFKNEDPSSLRRGIHPHNSASSCLKRGGADKTREGRRPIDGKKAPLPREEGLIRGA